MLDALGHDIYLRFEVYEFGVGIDLLSGIWDLYGNNEGRNL